MVRTRSLAKHALSRALWVSAHPQIACYHIFIFDRSCGLTRSSESGPLEFSIRTWVRSFWGTVGNLHSTWKFEKVRPNVVYFTRNRSYTIITTSKQSSSKNKLEKKILNHIKLSKYRLSLQCGAVRLLSEYVAAKVLPVITFACTALSSFLCYFQRIGCVRFPQQTFFS